ncbi:MAG: methyltransferase domain-containing protein, partial [Verrucomicrobia bacterium]
TLKDARRISSPIVFFCGGNDPWVDLTDVQEVVNNARDAEIVVIEEAKHEIRENASASKKAFREVVARVVKEAWGLDTLPKEVRSPDRKAMFAQNRIERERLRQSTRVDHTEDQFWSEYLGRYVLLEHVKDYSEYIDLVCDLAGGDLAEKVVLDAGCGNGMLGARLLSRAARGGQEMRPVYVGLDLTRSGLRDSMRRHSEIERGWLRAELSNGLRAADFAYSQVDFDQLGEATGDWSKLRFADETFDVVFCSLVLSYLKRPEVLVSEFRRILKAGGVCIVSSMKPHCDVSIIYKNFVETRETEEDVQSARNLLSGVGQIKQKEDLGFYTFYSGEELARLMKEAGFRDPQVYQSFGGQAVVVRALA